MGSGTGVPGETAGNSTNVSLCTYVSRGVAVGPNRLILIPANVTVRLPSGDITTFLCTEDNLKVGRNVYLSGNINIISDSCHKRVYTNLYGISSGPCRVRPFREVYRVIVTPIIPYSIRRIARLNGARHNRNNFKSANGGWGGFSGLSLPLFIGECVVGVCYLDGVRLNVATWGRTIKYFHFREV